MTHWWECLPERWAMEVDALRQAGINFQEDPAAARRGVKHLTVEREHDGQRLRLEATYPAEFPFFPPVVATSDIEFARHQAPGSGRLCLLGEGAWMPATDTLAVLLTRQWDTLLTAQPGPARDRDAETRQAEPITAYLEHEPNSFVGFPEFDVESLPERGTFRYAIENVRPLRATVLTVLREDGSEIARSDARSESDYVNRSMILTGRWVRLGARPKAAAAKDYYGAAIEADATLQRPSWQQVPGGSTRIDAVALLFADELSWEEQGGNVLVVSKSQETDIRNGRTPIATRLHRAELESHRLYALRDPGAPSLRPASVSITGLGSIGSPLARLLAQSGVGQVNLVDFDTLEAGNAIRWETGRSQAGRAKVVAMRELITLNFPYTKIGVSGEKVGDVRYAGTPEERRLHDLLFHKVDCVVDAAASNEVSYYLSAESRARALPHVWLYATNGAWGGFVGVADARRDAPCWLCHMLYLDDGTIPKLPAAPDTAGIHPPQCLDPTFTGSQVDLMEVSLMAARLVADRVRTARGVQPAHDYSWSFATLALRGDDGRRIPPVWTTHELIRHASCPYHQ